MGKTAADGEAKGGGRISFLASSGSWAGRGLCFLGVEGNDLARTNIFRTLVGTFAAMAHERGNALDSTVSLSECVMLIPSYKEPIGF